MDVDPSTPSTLFLLLFVDTYTPDSSDSNGGGGIRHLLTSTSLLHEVVRCAQAALRHTRPCSVPDITWDGTTRTYTAARAPADPCGCGSNSSSKHIGGGSCGTGAFRTESLLEGWVLLMSVCACSRPAVQELARAGMLDLLCELPHALRGAPTSLLCAVEVGWNPQPCLQLGPVAVGSPCALMPACFLAC